LAAGDANASLHEKIPEGGMSNRENVSVGEAEIRNINGAQQIGSGV